MPEADGGLAPLRRDPVTASDLIAVRELLKAEAQAIHQLAQTAIQALDEKTAAKFAAADEKMEALHRSQGERLEALHTSHEEKLEALNKAGWERIKDMDAASRERVTALQEQLTVIERLAVERLDSVRREIILMQKNSDEAIQKADAATEKRFESVNAFKEQISDLTKTFATRETVETIAAGRVTRFEQAEARLKELETWKSNSEGRQAIRAILWPIMVGVVVFFLTQVMRIMFPAPLAKFPAMYEVPSGQEAPVPATPRTP